MLFQKYFQKIFLHYPNPKLYLRGGAVISFKLLQDLNYFYPIEDFDFVLEDERCCNDYFYYEFGKEFGIFLNGSRKKSQGKNTKLHIMRNRSLLNFELSVCSKDTLELPMTSMKIYFTQENYISLFALINDIDYFDADLLKCIVIEIPDHDENGMFSLSFEIGDTIMENIIINTTNNKIHQQCLYYLIQNPTNIARLKYKNIPKSREIKKLYELYQNWLLNEDLILDLVERLIVNITNYINDIYENYKDILDDSYIEMFQKMDSLFENINIYRWIHSFDLLDPLLDIFQFGDKLKLNNTNSKILSKSPTWLTINKIKKLKS